MSVPRYVIEAKPTTQDLGVCTGFYENRTDLQRPASDRYGMPPRPTAVYADDIGTADVTAQDAGEDACCLCHPEEPLKPGEGAC